MFQREVRPKARRWPTAAPRRVVGAGGDPQHTCPPQLRRLRRGPELFRRDSKALTSTCDRTSSLHPGPPANIGQESSLPLQGVRPPSSSLRIALPSCLVVPPARREFIQYPAGILPSETHQLVVHHSHKKG